MYRTSSSLHVLSVAPRCKSLVMSIDIIGPSPSRSELPSLCQLSPFSYSLSLAAEFQGVARTVDSCLEKSTSPSRSRLPSLFQLSPFSCCLSLAAEFQGVVRTVYSAFRKAKTQLASQSCLGRIQTIAGTDRVA